MVKRADITPNNVHWIDYRKEKGIPIASPSNFIRISGENLAKLKKALGAQDRSRRSEKCTEENGQEENSGVPEADTSSMLVGSTN